MKKSLIALAVLAASGCAVASSRRRFDEEPRGHERRARLDMSPSAYIDTQLQLAALQSLIAAAGDVVSTNYYDTGAAQDEGAGEPLTLVARIGTAVTSGGAATLQPVLQSATDAAFTTPDEYPMTGAIAKAALTGNTVIARMRLPYGLKRYLRVVWRIGTAAITAGTADAFIVKDVDAQQYLPKNFTVS